MKSAMRKAAGATRRAGAGIARKLGVAADNYVYQMVVIIVGALWQLCKIFWGILVPSLTVAYVLALFRPGLWYYDDDTNVLDLNWLFGVEILEIAGFFVILIFLVWKGALRLSRVPLRTKVPDEVGFGLAFGSIAIALWAPRGTGVSFGLYSLGALRRAGVHFEPWVCWLASVGHLGCIGRALWKGPLSLLVGMVVATVQFAISAPLLGTPMSVAQRLRQRSAFRNMVRQVGPYLPGELLLSAVAPATALLYMDALSAFLRWADWTQDDLMGGTAVDGLLSLWIQAVYDTWTASGAGEGRQFCVYARCGIMLLRPDLTTTLRVSGRMLEAWKRLIPPQHYTPLPYLVFILVIHRLLLEGELQLALLTWLTYHCMLRPGEPLMAVVGDLVLPESIDAILRGERGVIQVSDSKRTPGVRMAGMPDILRPRQIIIFDKVLLVLLYFYVAGRPLDELLFPECSAARWRAVLQRLGQLLYLGDWQIVPRSLRPGGACHLHLDHGWPLADLVNRGGWRRFEATHAYLNTGSYASLLVSLNRVLAAEARTLARDWPRGLPIPHSLSVKMPEEVLLKFMQGGEAWGMEDASRSAPSAARPALRAPGT